MYMVLFASSVFILMGFIYWATAGYMSSQTDETIEAEIVGLAEQYQRQGLNGLISVIRERVARDPNGKAIYLFTARDFIKLAGNIDKWPEAGEVQDGWLNFTLNEELGWHTELERPARARVFIVPGGLRLLVGRDVNEFMAVKELIERAINLGMAFTFMLAMIGGIMMSRSTARRVEIINQTSQKIMRGNLSLRIPDRGTNDDFDQLARNLNEMLDRIFQLMEGIKHVSDNIAHDLRTPLTRLRNKLENTLLKVENEDQRELVASAVAEADQLLATFNALLRIARLEMGGRTDNFKNFSISELLLDAAELYEAVAEDKQQTLKIQVQSGLEIYGDKDLLFQTVSNVIDNAIKYTPNGGEINVSLNGEGKTIELIIADSGIGIPEEERTKVFDRFYRVAKSRSQPGNGLGLSLVQAVVELHAGSVALEDNAPGLKVKLELPHLEQSTEALAKDSDAVA